MLVVYYYYPLRDFVDYLSCVWQEKSLPDSNSSDISSIEELWSLRKQYPQSIIMSYWNINSKQIKWP